MELDLAYETNDHGVAGITQHKGMTQGAETEYVWKKYEILKRKKKKDYRQDDVINISSASFEPEAVKSRI